jgi:hypothetical protein
MIVIVIAALAEESLASVWVVVVPLSGMLRSASEVLASDIADVGDLPSIVASSARVIGRVTPFILTTSLSLYARSGWDTRVTKLEVILDRFTQSCLS